MKDVMLDLETMGTEPGSAIVAIGACYFDPSSGEIGDAFYTTTSLSSSVAEGLTIDADTVVWWMKQGDAARAEIYNAMTPLCEALYRFQSWMEPGCRVWGNGASFDNVILRCAYKAKLCKEPWEFWNDRDVRTVVGLGEMIGFNPKRDMPFDGVRHNAVDDAIHQAKYVSAIIQRLTK